MAGYATPLGLDPHSRATQQLLGPPAQPEPSPTEVEASLLSCNSHRERILQMLVADPTNRSLLDLLDQLSTAIAQLQNTRSMMLAGVPAACGLRAVCCSAGARGMAAAGQGGGVRKLYSSRKNKPQRCSICGGVGHKSRTCSMLYSEGAAPPSSLPVGTPSDDTDGILDNTAGEDAAPDSARSGTVGEDLSLRRASSGSTTGDPDSEDTGRKEAAVPAAVPGAT